jgi:2,4-dienoyl-CoA reductase-like NADH-dependent reductase (Old Yellow Enzyme family)/thioredoxin reductase
MTASSNALTQPGAIGSMTLKNRMVVSAMGANLAEADGSCGDRILAYHERQARGGVGLIIMGVTGVAWPHGGNQPRQVAISEDRHIPGLKAVADAVHKHGAKIAAQLHHAGLVAAQDMREGRPLWVPSYPPGGHSDLGDSLLEVEMEAFHDPDTPPVQLHVMTHDDIRHIVEKFADSAARAKAAGLDGVEIHAGHGYILSEFLSPAMNQRDDEYGGSLENRARFLVEVITAIRERVGHDYPLWVKLDTREYGREEGITLADAVATARLVEAAGADAITASAYHDANRGALHSESNIPHIPNHLVGNAARIREAIAIPVICVGRIEPEAASLHIERGDYDFLGMGRKMLADPDLPNKVAAGTPEAIRPCVYCYCCVSQIYVLKHVKCAVNPEVSFERERALIATDAPRHIGVVGGGPAGMEVSRRLSERGFRVTLFEASPRLGGTLQFASLAYPPNEKLLHWLRRQVAASNVEVRLNTRATPALLRAAGIEEVVVATGALREMPPIPGSDQSFVFSGDEMRALVMAEKNAGVAAKTSSMTRLLVSAGALTGLTSVGSFVRQASKVWLPLAQDLVIIGGELVGLELAEFLSERGRKVTVIESSARAGKGLYLVRRMRLLEELEHLGVTLITHAQDIAIGDHSVSYTNPRGQQRSVAAQQVIVAQGATGNTALSDALATEGFKTHTIGDCRGVTYIEGAMESAAELAATL